MTEASRWRPTPAILVGVLLALMCAAAVGPAYINHDGGWYLFVVQRWLGGARLYRDVIDTNPPLIIWLSAIPVLASRLFGAGAPAMFKIFVFIVAGVSTASTYRIIRENWPGREFVLGSAVAFVSLPFVKADFGQREHFAILLTLPYVFAAASAGPASPRWRRWAIGIAAGLGFSIKPHFVVAWACVEIAVAVSRGLRALERTELLTAVAAALAYAVTVAIVTPEYFTIADHVRRVYGGLNSPLSVLVRLREFQVWLLVAALFAAIRWPAAERAIGVLFAAATGYLAAGLLQLKGWGYQLYPARVFDVLFLASVAAVILDVIPGAAAILRGGRRGLAITFTCVLAIASARYVAEARHPAVPDLVHPFESAIAAYAPAGPFAVLSMRTIIYPAFPAVNYTGTRWTLRHNSLWFLPGFYEDQSREAGGPLAPHTLETMAPLERMFFDEIVDDLCAAPPQLLAVERPAASTAGGRRALDLEAYYSQSPRVMRLLRVYRAEGSIGPFALLVPAGAASCQ